MKKDDLLGTIGQTAVGVVTFTLGRAVALGGRVVMVGLGVLENALRGEQAFSLSDESPASRRGTGIASVPRTDADDDAGYASAPAFEASDGITPPARRSRSVTRRSSAGAAGATPRPRPVKRATARSLPPSVRPVTSMRSHRATPDPTPGVAPGPDTAAPGAAPVKAAAGASDLAPAGPAAAATTSAPGTAKKTTAKKTSATTAGAKRSAAKTAATKTTAAKKTTAKKTTAKKTTAKKTTAKKTTAKKAAAPATPATPAKQAAIDPSPPPGTGEGTVTPVAPPPAGERPDGAGAGAPVEG